MGRKKKEYVMPEEGFENPVEPQNNQQQPTEPVRKKEIQVLGFDTMRGLQAEAKERGILAEDFLQIMQEDGTYYLIYAG